MKRNPWEEAAIITKRVRIFFFRVASWVTNTINANISTKGVTEIISEEFCSIKIKNNGVSKAPAITAVMAPVVVRQMASSDLPSKSILCAGRILSKVFSLGAPIKIEGINSVID